MVSLVLTLKVAGYIKGGASGIRPVVCLNPDVKFVKSDFVVENSENACFELV